MNEPSPSLIEQIRSGPCQIINSRKAGGIIILNRHSAEFAGPGAVVATPLDKHCENVIPLGDLALVSPKSIDDILTGYRIRLQWIKLVSKSTSLENTQLRAQKILEQFEQFFRKRDVQQVPDEVLAQLVGVLPQTIRSARKKKQKIKKKL